MKELIKILFVEDNPTDIEIILAYLKREKMESDRKVVETESLYIDALDSYKPDIIISDNTLPQFDGMRALNIRNEIAFSVPFILVTGSVNEEVAVECMKSGADDYIIKDNLSRLGEAIKSAINKKKLMLQNILAEELLRESEKKYRLLVDLSPDAIIVHTDGKMVYANPGALKLVGASSFDLLYDVPVLSFVHPLYRDSAKKRIARILQTGEPSEYFQEKFIKLDKTEFDVEVIGIPVNYLGKQSVQTIIRDISARRQAEQRLQESFSFNDSLVKTIPFGMDIVDEEGNILFQNEKFRKLTGSTKNGEKCWELYRDDKKQCPNCPLIKGITTGVTQVDEAHGVLGGRIFEIHHTGMIFQGRKALLEIFQDITDRKKMEEKLIDSEAYYRTLIDISPDAVLTADMEGNLTYASKKTFEIFAIAPDAMVLGTSILKWVEPSYRQIIAERYNNIMAGHAEPETREYRLLKYDGSIFWGELSSSPLNGKNGRPTGLLIVCRDVTVRKKAEEEIIRTRDKAEESDKLKTAFLHNISHEIRTPMNAIVGFSALISEPGQSEELRQSYIDIIMTSSDHLLAIVSDIIEISNIEAGILKLNSNDFNLNSLLKNLLVQVSQESVRKKIGLSYEAALSDQDANIRSDSTKIIQILSNLLGNAIKFSDKGTVKFGYNLRDDYLEFYVADSGIGISPDQYEKIFDRFYQVDHSISRLYEGTGLGLSISKSYVEFLGGKIWLESIDPGGTVFYFTIPYLKPGKLNGARNRELDHKKYITSKEKTVLVAEDEENNYLLMKELLSSQDITIIHAKNGQEAVDLCLQHSNIGLVLMDIKMPVLDGYEATKRIRKILPGMPIIATTGYAFESDREKAISSGCSDYISKPVLKAALQNVLDKYLFQ